MISKRIIELIEKNEYKTEDEKEIFQYYETHQETELRNMIAMRNIGLIGYVMKQYGFKEDDVNAEDLWQEGFLGLCSAIDHFDYKKGYRFSTYACYWIRQAIQRYLHSKIRMIRFPVYLENLMNQVKQFCKEYQEQHGNKPDVSQIAKKLNACESNVKKALFYLESFSVGSLDMKLSSDGCETNSTLVDFIAADEEFAIQLEYESDMETLMNSIKQKLTQKEYLILTLRTGFETGEKHTLEEVGIIMNVTRERIRQIEKKIIKKIHTIKGIQEWKEYLSV